MIDDIEILTRSEVHWAAATGAAVVLVLVGVGVAIGVYWCPA